MRSTIRHIAVLAAAVVMLTAIAVPAQGAKGNKIKPPDVFEVTCYDPHYVVAVAENESRRQQWLALALLIPDPEPPPLYHQIDYEQASGTGFLRVQVEGSVQAEWNPNGEYAVDITFTTETKTGVRVYYDLVEGTC